MSAYPPPNDLTPVFNTNQFQTANSSSLDVAYLNAHYLQFPIGQGNITVPSAIVENGLTVGASIVMEPNATPPTNFLQFPDGSKQTSASNLGGVNASFVAYDDANPLLKTKQMYIDKEGLAVGQDLSTIPKTTTLTPTDLRFDNNGTITTALISDIIDTANAGDPTFEQVLTTGNEADINIILKDNLTTPTITNTITPTGVGIIGESVGSIAVNVGDPLTTGSASASISASTATNASFNLSCGGISTAPFFVPPTGTAGLTTSTTNARLDFTYNGQYTNGKILTLDLDGLTHSTSDGSGDFTISSNGDLLISSDNFNVSSSSMTIPALGQPITAQLTQNGLTMIDTTSGWNSWYRKANAFISNTAGTITAFLTNDYFQLTNTAGYTNMSATGINSVLSAGGQIQINSNGSALFTSTTSTGAAAPILTLQNSNAGASNSVAVETYKNISGAGTAGDEVFRLSMFGKNSSTNKEEYGRITCNIRDPSAPTAGADGQLLFAVPVNDTMTSFLDLNGNSNRVNCLRQLNVQNNDIISSAGNIYLNASASSGSGQVILEPKVGSYLILNNLPTSSAGLPSGAVWRNGNVLNIV